MNVIWILVVLSNFSNSNVCQFAGPKMLFCHYWLITECDRTEDGTKQEPKAVQYHKKTGFIKKKN